MGNRVGYRTGFRCENKNRVRFWQINGFSCGKNVLDVGNVLDVRIKIMLGFGKRTALDD